MFGEQVVKRPVVLPHQFIGLIPSRDDLGMEGIDVPFNKVQTLSSQEVYAHVKKTFLKHRKADAIYLLGSGWHVMEVIDLLEQDLGVPVVHPVSARCSTCSRTISA